MKAKHLEKQIKEFENDDRHAVKLALYEAIPAYISSGNAIEKIKPAKLKNPKGQLVELSILNKSFYYAVRGKKVYLVDMTCMLISAELDLK